MVMTVAVVVVAAGIVAGRALHRVAVVVVFVEGIVAKLIGSMPEILAVVAVVRILEIVGTVAIVGAAVVAENLLAV